MFLQGRDEGNRQGRKPAHPHNPADANWPDLGRKGLVEGSAEEVGWQIYEKPGCEEEDQNENWLKEGTAIQTVILIDEELQEGEDSKQA